ncbi:MAG TPA: AsmA family protein [Terracidiphilus sp.]|nr:AsmA family protein [Terracidiphilus sp.]
MTEEAERQNAAARRRRTRKRLWLAVVLAALLLAFLVIPPMISIGRYKNRIASIVSASLGRPVHLSSVELRLLPLPGFVLTDLTVDEDPAYGSEPVLHASTVTTAIRLSSLWRGRIEISRISVDEASLNLVRTTDGRWNLDPLFRTAAAHTHNADAAHRAAVPLPYLEATNSRVNIKNGLEKLPFSLVNADVSFWEENPGDWRLRLRGQPARTDVSLALADTGIVRLEARLKSAPELREMPLHVEMEWREAQLGQLSRLILGSDPGWRGDLTGEMQLDGTAAAAQIKARLSATGVHRAEFAPADALDFDANCTLVYHYSARSIENLACDSPLGEGHLRVTGDMPASGPHKLAVNVQRVPLSAGLDMLRTLRSGVPDDLEARGTISGQLAYNPDEAQPVPTPSAVRRGKKAPKANDALPNPLQGNLTIDGFQLEGGGLTQPIQLARVTFTPAPAEANQPPALNATASIPLGGASPLALTLQLARSGYQINAHGTAALPKLRELAHVAGLGNAAALDGLAGDPAMIDLTAQGQWLPPSYQELNGTAVGADQLTGTVTLENANWKSQALASPVMLPAATLHLTRDAFEWNPVSFAYGPVKGTATLQVPLTCAAGETCPPQLDLSFNQLDLAALQAALLGAPKQGSVLSALIDRFTAASAPAWPRIDGTAKAGSVVLGPVTLEKAAMSFSLHATGADFTSIDAGLLGGQVHLTGSLASGDKPAYTLEGSVNKAAAPALCALFRLRCTGGPINADGKLTLTGFAAKDLASSAAGTLHFEWRNGSVSGPGAAAWPKVLARFSRWTADGTIGHDGVTLKQSVVQLGSRKSTVDAAVSFGEPPTIAFPAVAQPPAKR